MNRNELVLMTDIFGGDYIIILFEIKPDGFLNYVLLSGQESDRIPNTPWLLFVHHKVQASLR